MDKIFKYLGRTLGTPVVSPTSSARPSDNYEAGPSGMAPGAARAHSHHSHQQAVPQRAPAPVSYGQPGAQQPSYGQQVAHGGGRPVMDIMEAGPSRPSADPINDFFGRFAGDDDDNHDNENDDPGAGTAPRRARRQSRAGPVSDHPRGPRPSETAAGPARKPNRFGSSRRGPGGGFGFGDGGFRLRTSQARRVRLGGVPARCMQPRLRTPGPEPEPEPEPRYEAVRAAVRAGNTITSPSWSPRGVAAAGGCSRCRESNCGPAPRGDARA